MPYDFTPIWDIEKPRNTVNSREKTDDSYQRGAGWVDKCNMQ